jgi:hypothetical protein
VLALAAACSVLEMEGVFHHGTVFAFSLFEKFFAFVFVRPQLAG